MCGHREDRIPSGLSATRKEDKYFYLPHYHVAEKSALKPHAMEHFGFLYFLVKELPLSKVKSELRLTSKKIKIIREDHHLLKTMSVVVTDVSQRQAVNTDNCCLQRGPHQGMGNSLKTLRPPITQTDFDQY